MNLLGLVLAEINYEFNGMFAWFEVSEKMIKKAKAGVKDVDGFSDMVRSIRGVEISMMIMETGVNSCRINFRSKGKLKVRDLANYLGGGGHAYAAGAKVEESILSFKNGLLGDIKQLIRTKVGN